MKGLILGGGGGGQGRVWCAYSRTKKSVSKQALSLFFLVHQPKCKCVRHTNDHAHD